MGTTKLWALEPCQEGRVQSGYPCKAVSLGSVLDLTRSGKRSERGNDIWGWTDAETGKEYALMGLDNKTSFVEVTDPSNPIHVADLPSATLWSSVWRDVKVYKNHAFIVSEAWRHGMQVVNLEKLRDIATEDYPARLEADTRYRHFGSAHNIVINEESGFAYAVGTTTCDAGMHVVDIRQPLEPRFSTCVDRAIFEPDIKPKSMLDLLHSDTGEDYTHDAQCVIYRGPDVEHQGKEICVASNADTVNIVDVSDKAKPLQISVKDYGDLGYTHQGWMTEDHRFFILGDELDEVLLDLPTRTLIWNIEDLDKPFVVGVYESTTKSIDHNLYVKGRYLYQANYEAGLRILDLVHIEKGQLKEVGFFDTMPHSDVARFDGAWSIFPFFNSGTVVLSNIDGRLFVLRPELK